MEIQANRAPGRPRSQASRSAILDAAYWQVSERGYAAVTAESIAKAAGAGKQTLYRWWPSKAAVILDAIAEKERARIDRPQELAIRAGDLPAFLRAVIPAIAANGQALRHLIGEAQFDPKLRAALKERMIEPRRENLRQVLASRALDAHRREALIAAIFGAIWHRLLLDEPVDEALAIELAALAPPSREARDAAQSL
jgi:AcrR family transcriptional regulator